MAEVTKRENIVIVVRTYTDKQGEEKNVYKTIGEITTFNGENGEFKKADLYHIPGANISVYPQEPRKKETAPKEEVPTVDVEDDGEIKVKDIPF